MTRRINTLLLMLLMLVVSSTAYALDDNERAILQRVGISADDEALRFNDDGHIYAVHMWERGLKTIPFALLELPYVEEINLNSNQEEDLVLFLEQVLKRDQLQLL